MSEAARRLTNGVEFPSGPRLKRGLSLLEATTLVIGGIIGSGIFMVPSLVAREVEAPGLSLLVWVVCGLISVCGALCLAELASLIPRTGGQYTYLLRSYPTRLVGFFYGWSMFFIIQTASIAAVAATFAAYAGYFLGGLIPYGTWTQRTVAVAAILFLGSMNCIGVRVGGQIQNLFTFLKLAGLAALIGTGFLFGPGDLSRLSPFMPETLGEAGLLASFGTAMIAGLFAYNGWAFSTFVAGETKNPSRNIPLSIILGMGIVLVVYLAANFVYFYILPFDELRSSSLVAADTMQAIIGPSGAAFISLTIVLSTFGTLNVQLLTTSRIYFAMSRDHLFFRWFDQVHPRFRTPVIAIMVQALWSCGFALSGTYGQIVAYMQFPQQAFALLSVAAVILLRRTAPDLPRPYRTWGYPVTPLVFLLVISWFLVNSLVYRFGATMVGIVLTLTGIPFYYYWTRKKR